LFLQDVIDDVAFVVDDVAFVVTTQNKQIHIQTTGTKRLPTREYKFEDTTIAITSIVSISK
jgi:hypothetical protein